MLSVSEASPILCARPSPALPDTFPSGMGAVQVSQRGKPSKPKIVNNRVREAFRIRGSNWSVHFTGNEQLALERIGNNFSLAADFILQPQPVCACEEPADVLALFNSCLLLEWKSE